LVGSGRHFLINLARTLFGGFETVTESQKKGSDHENDDTPSGESEAHQKWPFPEEVS